MYSIIIDGSADPSFGSDQAFVSYPTVFPTVSFQLVSTDDLVSAAMSLLSDAGDEADDFTFYLGINGFTKTGLDNSIVAVAPDDTTVNIPLDEAEQEKVFALLNKECFEKFGKGCDGILEEARCQMRDVSFSLEEE